MLHIDMIVDGTLLAHTGLRYATASKQCHPTEVDFCFASHCMIVDGTLLAHTGLRYVTASKQCHPMIFQALIATRWKGAVE